jgi:hypothetical protein
MENISAARKYEIAAGILKQQLARGLSPAEAVDYIAVDKAGRANKDWAGVRGVSDSTVSGNISQAREQINTRRLDAEVLAENGDIVAVVTDSEGEQHRLPFSRETEVMGYGDATLQLVYEAMSGVHGYYQGEDGEEFEATLWFDDRPRNSFEEFDHYDQFGSARAKADAILWESEEFEK